LHKQKTRVSKRASEGNRQSCKGQAPQQQTKSFQTEGEKKKDSVSAEPGTFRTHSTNSRGGSPSRPSGALDNDARLPGVRRVSWVAPTKSPISYEDISMGAALA